MKGIRSLLILLVTLCHTSWGFAQEYSPEQIPNVQLSDSTQYVSDPTGHISVAERAMINDMIAGIKHKYGVRVALVIVPAVKNNTPERFAHELFQLWGIGEKSKDNGLLILYGFEKPNRFIRFEVGYGLEGILTDALTSQISRKRIIPHIVEDRTSEGLIEGIRAVTEELDRSYTDEGFERRRETDGMGNFLLKTYLILSLVIAGAYIFFVNRKLKEKNLLAQYAKTHANVWHFLGGMAILFPIAWIIFYPWLIGKRKVINTKIRNCDNCHGINTVKVSVADRNNILLNSVQRKEVDLGSKKYYVSTCSNCHISEIAGISVKTSGYQLCMKCGGLTMALQNTQHYSAYKDKLTYKCLHCSHTKTHYIPRISSNNRGPGRGSGGSWGGGGGSWGGGSSGGGGSTVRF
ncbi:YgcG family protein [Porphyromonas sp.]|uniref:TPM domain-containing protein n=1 Tax=Porphyromonas sp. TaxID=1924944 RepID=UPI0026DBE500|nr:TPM domain-containing protein [Porphyromonas sp.]MDO4695357.1 TPM domain-containing protein [Porphyromonas sp.]MDO4770358.1 TPM domain-containing protein [Porphyromonas sp.]